MWQRLPGRPDAEHETLQRLELENGSRVISLPGNEKTVRRCPMGRGARTRFPERFGPGPYFTPSATSSPLPARF
jgi:hypothetical protein